MTKKIEKQCISCGQKGHTYLECDLVPFFSIASRVITGIDLIDNRSDEELLDNLNKARGKRENES